MGDDGESKKYDATNYKDFITDTFKSLTEPEQPRLTIIFQWNPEQEYQTNDFTDNLLDACNYKILCTIQGKKGWGEKGQKFLENCEKMDCTENMTDEGSCIRIRSLISALKGATKPDIDQMKETIVNVLPEVALYFDQAYELWLATEQRSELSLDLDPNDDLTLGAIAFLPTDAPHDQINEEIFRLLLIF